MTKFQILLKEAERPDWWIERGTVEAHNAADAVKKAYLKKPGNTIVMVAVPARSWKPTPIRTETVTKVVLGDEKTEPPKEAA